MKSSQNYAHKLLVGQVKWGYTVKNLFKDTMDGIRNIILKYKFFL